MPSSRRVKVLALVVSLLTLLALYITASGRQTRASQFYTTTQDALAQARAAKEAKMVGREVATGEDPKVRHRLKEAEEEAKRKAEKKGTDFHGEETKQKVIEIKGQRKVPGVAGLPKVKEGKARDSGRGQRLEKGEKGVAGRKVMKDGSKDKQVAMKDDNEAEKDHKETADEERAHHELNDILKKSPIIIFSKSYCPYSKRAKHILLEKYNIMPPPYVVELDIHPLGPHLQAYLGDITGRRTVPNILINAKSIGGGDDVQELDESGKLMDTVRSMGGKRMEISKVAPEGTEKAPKPEKRSSQPKRVRRKAFL